MRVIVATFLSLITMFSAAAPADEAAQGRGPLGIGVIIGEPTGIAFKRWSGGRTAFDAAAAWSFADETALHLHVDHLWHWFDKIDAEEGQAPVYMGIGGRVKFGEHDELIGVRVPFGVSFLWNEAPVDAFLELVPLLDLMPDTDFRLNAAIGARYYFR